MPSFVPSRRGKLYFQPETGMVAGSGVGVGSPCRLRLSGWEREPPGGTGLAGLATTAGWTPDTTPAAGRPCAGPVAACAGTASVIIAMDSSQTARRSFVISLSL